MKKLLYSCFFLLLGYLAQAQTHTVIEKAITNPKAAEDAAKADSINSKKQLNTINFEPAKKEKKKCWFQKKKKKIILSS